MLVYKLVRIPVLLTVIYFRRRIGQFLSDEVDTDSILIGGLWIGLQHLNEFERCLYAVDETVDESWIGSGVPILTEQMGP